MTVVIVSYSSTGACNIGNIPTFYRATSFIILICPPWWHWLVFRFIVPNNQPTDVPVVAFVRSTSLSLNQLASTFSATRTGVGLLPFGNTALSNLGSDFNVSADVFLSKLYVVLFSKLPVLSSDDLRVKWPFVYCETYSGHLRLSPVHLYCHMGSEQKRPVQYEPHRKKTCFDICKQQRRRSACASAQSDQHLCCSLPRKYNTSSFYIRNFKPLPSFCGWAGRFESYLVADPENRFSRDEAHSARDVNTPLKNTVCRWVVCSPNSIYFYSVVCQKKTIYHHFWSCGLMESMSKTTVLCC